MSRTRAIVARDMEAIERLHAPEYELITPAGRVFTRARYLAAIAAEPFYAAWEHGPMQVRASSSIAVVRYQAKLTFPSGKVLDCWHTDIYELRGSQWQAVWSQATQLPSQAAGAGGSEA
ncbi:MAG: nuclear transport factor 2 family protein [Pseudomonadota bacterium]